MSAPKYLFISFSGGETSAYMTWWLMENEAHKYDAVLIVFANTGQEHPETLIFVDRCARHFGWNVIWVETVVHHNQRKSSTHRVVTFETACRDGTLFEQMIRKYGIPNKDFPHCTRELKTNPINSFKKSVLPDRAIVHMAIGIRDDEVDRRSSHAEALGLIYPLIDLHPMTKPQINEWWRNMPFRLGIEAWKGNCVWCWKKTDRKHFRNIQDNPDWYAFPAQMERQYPRVGAEFSKYEGCPDRVFFRQRRSTKDMIAAAQGVDCSDLNDSNELDYPGGCGDSCEIYSDYEAAE